MVDYLFLIHFSLSFLLLCHSSISSDLIDETCKNASRIDPNVSYDFCTASLESYPRSRNSTTLQELGVSSIELTISNATHITSHVAKLLKHKNYDPFVKSCLQDCLELYLDAIPLLKGAVYDFKLGDYRKANIELSAAMDASTTCEEGFAEKRAQVSVLTKENNMFFQLTAIALAFTKFVHD